MQQTDALKGHLEIKWFEDGRLSMTLPADVGHAYAMLHFALDEIQERMMQRKANGKTREQLHSVPKDGKLQPTPWGS